MDEVISVSDVSKWLGEKKVLNNISWNVKTGQHWVMLGLNGSGKTTLLKIATGSLWPTKGEVSVLGHKLGSMDIRELRKSIGWVSSFLNVRIPQSQKSSDVVVSGRYASIGLYQEPSEEDYKRVNNVMELMECAGVADVEFGALSQGEKQRVLISRALMPDPKLLILDEPCVGLDMRAREGFLKSVGNLTKDGPTIVFVTHHVDEIIGEFTHAILLKDGKAVAQGGKNDVVNSENLSAAFGLNITVEKSGCRYAIKYT